MYANRDPTPSDFGARLGLRLMFGLGSGTRYIDILLIVYEVGLGLGLGLGCMAYYTPTGVNTLFFNYSSELN